MSGVIVFMPFLAFTTILIVFVFFVKRILLKKKEGAIDYILPNGTEVGNAQLIGEKEYQNDYFTTTYHDGVLFSAIADGLTNKKIGKFASVVTIEMLKENFRKGMHKQLGSHLYFSESIKAINKRLNDNIYGNKVGAALIAVLIDNGVLHFASVGNCSLFLYRNGEIINVNDIHSMTIQISKFSLAQEDVIMLCSKGAFESLTEREISWHLSEQNHPYGKCQGLAKQIRQKALGHQDNATVIILEKMV